MTHILPVEWIFASAERASFSLPFEIFFRGDELETAVTELKGEIQKVSARLEVNKPALRTVLNNH